MAVSLLKFHLNKNFQSVICVCTWLLAPWADAEPSACDRWMPSWWKPPRWLNPSTLSWARHWSGAYCPACGHTPLWSAAQRFCWHPGPEKTFFFLNKTPYSSKMQFRTQHSAKQYYSVTMTSGVLCEMCLTCMGGDWIPVSLSSSSESLLTSVRLLLSDTGSRGRRVCRPRRYSRSPSSDNEPADTQPWLRRARGQ